jgi:hypothetical protein
MPGHFFFTEYEQMFLGRLREGGGRNEDAGERDDENRNSEETAIAKLARAPDLEVGHNPLRWRREFVMIDSEAADEY